MKRKKKKKYIYIYEEIYKDDKNKIINNKEKGKMKINNYDDRG